MPEFYTTIARKKYFFPIFFGGRHVPPTPVSYAYAGELTENRRCLTDEMDQEDKIPRLDNVIDVFAPPAQC